MNIKDFNIIMESTEVDYVTDDELWEYEKFIVSVAKDIVFSDKSREYIKKTINSTPEEIFCGKIHHKDYIEIFDCDQDERIDIYEIIENIAKTAIKRNPKMAARADVDTGDGDEGCVYVKPKKEFKPPIAKPENPVRTKDKPSHSYSKFIKKQMSVYGKAMKSIRNIFR